MSKAPTRPEYRYKTEPRGKQLDVIEGTWFEPVWALLCRPGTGKTKIDLDSAGLNYMDNRIDALIVVCPEGVDRQWIEEGVPTHLSDDVPRVVGNYRSDLRIRAFRKLEKDMLPTKPAVGQREPLRILAFSFDGLQTPRGRKLAAEMTSRYRCMAIDDESHRTANPKAAISKALKPVMRASRVKRIGTGTLVRQNPFSAWGQFDLMGDALLGFASLASFKSMYAEMLPPTNPLVQHISRNLAQRRNRRDADGKLIVTPVTSIQAKDDQDRPIYRNLADLRQRLSRYSSFLTLADVNGKEPVVNEVKRFVQLTKTQRALYDDLVNYGVALAPGGQLTAEGSLALSIRLAQCAGGFAPSDDDPRATPVGDVNPKLDELMALIEELGDTEKLVVWCKYSAELDAVVGALKAKFGAGSTVEYHGRCDAEEKAEGKHLFTSYPHVRFFVGQQKAGGTGLDGLQAVAQYMAFYSNDYSYLERLQAISRLARTNGFGVVTVWDIVAEHTVDEDIVTCLRTAQDVSEAVLRRAIVREWE